MAYGSQRRATLARLLGPVVAVAGAAGITGAQTVEARRAPNAEESEAADPLRLFRAVPAPAEERGGDPAILRSRRVALNLDPGALEDAVVLDLFDDVSIAAFREERGGGGEGRSAVWRGSIPGKADGRVTLVARDGVLVGTIRADGALYRVMPTADGGTRVEQVDETRLPGCGASDEHHVSVQQAPGEMSFGSPTTPAMTSAADGTGTHIDVMVVYTPQTRSAMGSAAAVEALIELAVLETNEAFVDSGVDLCIELAHVTEVAYDESGDFQTDLARMQNANDEYLAEVHELRDMYGADFVSMIVASGQYCGIGYVMSNPGPYFANYAFSVVSRGCATGYFSFAHELGHNLGCQHDHDHSGNGAYPYSYGHHNGSSTWRTIMAYAPGTRIQRFSNPDRTYLGESTGNPIDQSEPAHNAHSINEVAEIVEAFREPAITAYGWGKATSQGQIAVLGWEGMPSASDGEGCSLVLSNAIPGQLGIIHRGSEPAEVPFRGGTLWVQGPVVGVRSYRTSEDGTASHPLPNTPSLVGTTDYFQLFFRDPSQTDGSYIGMTNGVKVTYLP